MKKTKNLLIGIGATALSWVVIIVFLPVIFLLFIGAILYTPIDYVKFKTSIYQKDYPRKYKWLCGRHEDNKIYEAIKENALPISYFKSCEDYELHGDFVYEDTILDFSTPFFYDDEKETWLYSEQSEVHSDECEHECTDEYLSVEEAKNYLLEQFAKRNTVIKCTKIVFFYEIGFVKAVYGEKSLAALREEDSVILYKKRELPERLQHFTK